MKWYWKVLVSAVACGLLAAFLTHPPTTSQDWASWVQAIGSIFAVLVAIWVSADQHSKQIKRDSDREDAEILGILRSLRSEIETVSEGARRNIGNALELSDPGTAFMAWFPAPERPFVVYEGLIPKIGMLKDHALRNQIILTYARAFGLVQSFRFNNKLIDDFLKCDSLAKRNKFQTDLEAAENAKLILASYGDSLRASYVEVKKHVKELLSMLQNH